MRRVVNNSAIQVPMVSVLLPVYNAEKYICDSIDSILSQTYRNFELIVVDDGSTDNTKEVVTKKFDDDRIRYLALPDNVGIVDALNIALAKSEGKYLARMDADDISHPERFSRQIKFLEANLEYVACGSSITIVGDKVSPYKVVYPKTHEEVMSALYLFHRSISHPGVMMRSDTINKHHIRYSRKYPHAEDYMLWKELAVYGKLHNLAESLLFYSYHDEQVSSVHYEAQMASSRDIVSEFLSEFLDNESLKLQNQSYINFLVHEKHNENYVLPAVEAKTAMQDLLRYTKKCTDIDTKYAKKIILYKYCLTSFHYRYSLFIKVRRCFYCFCASPILMIKTLMENYRHFFKKKKDKVKKMQEAL